MKNAPPPFKPKTNVVEYFKVLVTHMLDKHKVITSVEGLGKRFMCVRQRHNYIMICAWGEGGLLPLGEKNFT